MQHLEQFESYADVFHARAYLQQYYTSVDHENEQLLTFFADCHKETLPHTTILEFGSGPALYALITAAAKVEAIHVCDHFENNLQEIQAWQRGDEGAFNWDAFIRRALELEGIKNVTDVDITQRAALLKQKLTHFFLCDARSPSPLQGNHCPTYDLVQANFVLESVASSLAEWEKAFQNLLSLLSPQGTLLLSSVKNAAYYQIQGQQLPTASIDEHALKRVLSKANFKTEDIAIQAIPSNPPYRGYSEILLVKASRTQ